MDTARVLGDGPGNSQRLEIGGALGYATVVDFNLDGIPDLIGTLNRNLA